ncbi:MAG TPA: SDR family NAD(P)-dependent oxidoreductase [Fimbriiglobus sp.]|nr:SDR family NAD(P)-dependent oxidoreductase [Fimbriiglobus sp.]
MSFADRTAVITGASSGIGRALAKALAAKGTRVGVTARRGDLLDELVREVRAAGGTIEAAVADVADRAAITAAIRQLEATLGPVDLLIANAGVGLPSGTGPDHVEAVERMVRVNLLGVVYAFDAAMGGMLTRKSGHLVAVSSMAAYKGLPGSAGYCASKAAVNAYCEGLRIELRSRGVAVTCVCPGFIDTPMTATNPKPMPFLMTPDEAARRIVGALRRMPAVYNFPWPMRGLMWLSKWVPDWYIARQVPAERRTPSVSEGVVLPPR